MAISRKPLYAAILCSLAMTMSACASGPVGGSADALQRADAAAQDYQLASGDKVHIDVFGEGNLSGDYVVAPDGKITLPLAGQVAAAGFDEVGHGGGSSSGTGGGVARFRRRRIAQGARRRRRSRSGRLPPISVA